MNQLLFDIAQFELGTREVAGVENNSRILHYAKRAGLDWVKNDETSWCGIFLGFCIAELPEFIRPKNWPQKKAATARQWINYGIDVPIALAKPGDIVVFWRESPESWKGHVALFVEDTGDTILCLGGNQGDEVSIKGYDRERLLGIRRY